MFGYQCTGTNNVQVPEYFASLAGFGLRLAAGVLVTGREDYRLHHTVNTPYGEKGYSR